jgi:hypothetical protein
MYKEAQKAIVSGEQESVWLSVPTGDLGSKQVNSEDDRGMVDLHALFVFAW